MSYKDILNSLSNDSDLRTLTDEESGKLKALLLDNYMRIQRFCQKHHLSVMLVGGSALGAVRHKGFIPWDDDLDIAMPRKDYNKFKRIFEKELGEYYALDAPNTGMKSSNRFPKILIKNTKLVELGMSPDDKNACIKIDLFIIENIPTNKLLRYIHGMLCTGMMFIAGQVDSYEARNDQFKTFMYKSEKGKKEYDRRMRIGRLFSFRPAYKWFNTVDRVCQWKRSGKYMGIPTGRKHYFGEILPSEAFIPVSEGEFEGKKAYLPGNADAYLKNLFGDYMKVPEKADREKHFIYDIEFE